MNEKELAECVFLYFLFIFSLCIDLMMVRIEFGGRFVGENLCVLSSSYQLSKFQFLSIFAILDKVIKFKTLGK